METKVKNREWVKDAAIIFLVVLLILTFFSNTIMNRTLPEVATAEVTGGSIVAKVRGSGTVTANGKHQVKAKEVRTIRSVMVKVGQEVNAGDVLFVLGEGDATALEQAKETLRNLQTNYQRTAVSAPVYNYSSQEAAIRRAEMYYDKVLAQLEEAESKLEFIDSNPTVKSARQRWENEGNRLDAMENQYNEERVLYTQRIEIAQDEFDAYDAVTQYKMEYWQSLDPDDPDYANAELEYTNAKIESDAKYTALETEQAALEDYDSKAFTELEKQRNLRDSYYTEYAYLVGTAAEDYEQAQYAVQDAEIDLQNAYDSLAAAQETNSHSAASVAVDLNALAEEIRLQQEKIKSLAGDEENVITANVSGTVDTVDCTAGDTVLKDALLCTIEVPDMGHTLTFSVTNDQAQRLRIGDTATISNYYWGNTITATLTTIRTDPKNPQTNKLLTFDLTGDVTTGAELTISVGQKSANYDLIVPNSAIKSDTNGRYVLAVAVKSSPLGNRYTARRVSVEVLASDDNNSAVVADLSNGDYVITTSSAPLSSGDMVRMADS